MPQILLPQRFLSQPQHPAQPDYDGLAKGVRILWNPAVGPIDLVTRRTWTTGGNASIITGQHGRLFLLDGDGDHYSYTGYPELTGSSGTFFAFFTQIGPPNSFGHVYLSSSAPAAVALQVNQDGKIFINGAGSTTDISGWFATLNRSLVLVASPTSSKMKAYIDGKNSGLAWSAGATAWGSGNKTLRFGGYPAGASWDVNARILVAGWSEREWTQEEARSFHSNPWLLFRAPDRRILYTTSFRDLLASSPTQANAVSTAEISITGVLSPSSLSQANAASAGQVTRSQDLTVSNLTQGNSVTTGGINPYNRLRALLKDLPLHTWAQVNTTQYIDCQMASTDRPTAYPNATDHVKIVIPWSSIAFDHTRGHLLLWGGGHANYSGNQLYQWHADTGEWSMACLPSGLTADANMYVVDKKAPQSSHTYQNNFWLQNNDMFGTFGGAATPAGSTVVEDNAGNPRRVGPWLYDLTKTDPEKVGGGDGSGVDASRLGLNAWQHRRDNVPTGTAGTNTYPIDYKNHVSQASVSVSKDGKDYVIFTVDSNSGFPFWYRYEFGDVRSGEDDTCVYLGNTTQSNTIVTEGWMVYDSKRELVYRNGYNKNVSYTQCEIVAKKPWVAGVAETPIRLVKSSDGTTFSMQPVSDECPYGAAYDERNDCIYLWGGTSPDTGVVYKVNIPAYDATTGWSSTTWTVDTITPAGSRPNGLYQTPVLGKVKYVPELSSLIILDKAGAAGDPDPGVWLFKTAQIQGDLTASNADQGNSASTGLITIEHTLSAVATAQVNTASSGGITQTHALVIASGTQANAASTGAISPGNVNDLVASSATQANAGSTGAITQAGVLVAAPSVQDNIAAASAIVQTHVLAASSVTQNNTASSGAISAGDGFLVSVVERTATFRRSKSVTVRFN